MSLQSTAHFNTTRELIIYLTQSDRVTVMFILNKRILNKQQITSNKTPN
jgi:hypothetical protein